MAVVHVAPGEATEVAQDLLAAAVRLGLDPKVVRTSSDGLFGLSFEVPDEVYDMSGLIRIERAKGPDGPLEDPAPEDEAPAPKKRRAARKVQPAAEELAAVPESEE